MDILSHLGRWLSDERFTANLLAAHGVVVALVLAALVLRRLLLAGQKRLRRWTDKSRLEALGSQAVRQGHTLLFWLTLLAIAGTIGTSVVYHLTGGDIRDDFTAWFRQFTVKHLTHTAFAAAGVLGAWIACAIIARMIRKLLPLLQAQAKDCMGRKSNEQHLQCWCNLLERTSIVAIRLLGVLLVGRVIGLGRLTDHLVGFVLILFSIFAVARLLTLGFRTVTGVLADFGNRYFASSPWRHYWERATGLFPFANRCFEAAVYVSAAWLVVEHMYRVIPALLDPSLGWRIVFCIGIFFCTRVLIELLQVLLCEAFGMYSQRQLLNQKGRTLVPLLHSMGQYVLYFGSGVTMLGLFMDTTPILAGAGIVGLAVGLGAQTLVTDLVSGFFILFEGQFLVGDYVQINEAHGVVEGVALRTTQIRDGNGKLHIIPNGQIKGVVSYSKGYVNAVVDYKAPAGSDLESLFRAMREAGHELREHHSEVLADTEIHGVVDLGQSDMTVRAVTRVQPGTHGIIQSEYRRLLKQYLEAQQPLRRPALAA